MDVDERKKLTSLVDELKKLASVENTKINEEERKVWGSLLENAMSLNQLSKEKKSNDNYLKFLDKLIIKSYYSNKKSASIIIDDKLDPRIQLLKDLSINPKLNDKKVTANQGLPQKIKLALGHIDFNKISGKELDSVWKSITNLAVQHEQYVEGKTFFKNNAKIPAITHFLAEAQKVDKNIKVSTMQEQKTSPRKNEKKSWKKWNDFSSQNEFSKPALGGRFSNKKPSTSDETKIGTSQDKTATRQTSDHYESPGYEETPNMTLEEMKITRNIGKIQIEENLNDYESPGYEETPNMTLEEMKISRNIGKKFINKEKEKHSNEDENKSSSVPTMRRSK